MLCYQVRYIVIVTRFLQQMASLLFIRIDGDSHAVLWQVSSTVKLKMKKTNPIPEELIAPCGMNCAICSRYFSYINNLNPFITLS